MFKKTAIALAVAGTYGASLPVQAQETESGFYGFVNVSMDYADTENGGTGSNIFLPPALTATSTWVTRPTPVSASRAAPTWATA